MFTPFSSQINELKQFKIRQRQEIIALSLDMLSPSERVLLRIMKLILLSPLFLIFTVFQSWLLIPFLILGGLCYPLLTTPIEIYFAKKNLSSALKAFNQSR
ncbi:DUF6170 family protein [Pseudoalteromonas aliena]|uniref:DUF6170 family protein n=1 Tax=Pseudoalteromonas aliena TaxID=247523 RepID=UPI00311E0028